MIDEQVQFLQSKSVEGLQPVEEVRFDTPQPNRISPVLPEELVTSAKRYENGVYVYENPQGMKGLDGANRLITDHQTFIQTEWDAPQLVTDRFMIGATVTTKLARLSHNEMYSNPDGLFGRGSSTVLIADENWGLDSRFSPVRLTPSEGRLDFSAGDYRRAVRTIADNFNRTDLDAELDRLVEQPGSSPAEARNIVVASSRGLDGRVLVDFLGKAGTEGRSWLDQNDSGTKFGITVYTPAGDGSASPLAYVMGKASGHNINAKPLPETLPDSAILFFGDVSTLSAAETASLQQHNRPIAIIDPAFGRGLNVIDMVKGTAHAKLKSLVERSRQADVIEGPSLDMATRLNARYINPTVSAPRLTEEGLNRYLEKAYPNMEDRALAAELFANGLDYISMYQYAQRAHSLASAIESRGIGPLAGQSNLYFVQQQGKSSELLNYFVQAMTELPPERMVTESRAAQLVKNPGNHVWFLDDATYSGHQMSGRAASMDAPEQLSIGTLAAYSRGLNELKGFDVLSMSFPTPLKSEFAPNFFKMAPADQLRAIAPGGIVDGQMTSVLQALAFRRFYHNHATVQNWGDFGSRTSFFYMSSDNAPFFVRDYLNQNYGTPRAFTGESYLCQPLFEKSRRTAN